MNTDPNSDGPEYDYGDVIPGEDYCAECGRICALKHLEDGLCPDCKEE